MTRRHPGSRADIRPVARGKLRGMRCPASREVDRFDRRIANRFNRPGRKALPRPCIIVEGQRIDRPMNKPFFRPRAPSGRPAGPSSETALGWLGHDTRGAGVLATARRHLQLQRAVASLLPPGLGAVCVVAKLEGGCLQLAVPGPAHAAKLRQMAPRLAQALSGQGWNTTEVTVKVQAGMPRPGARTPRPPKTAQPLGPSALQAFESLGRTVRPGPLADAIARLLDHHRGSGSDTPK